MRVSCYPKMSFYALSFCLELTCVFLNSNFGIFKTLTGLQVLNTTDCGKNSTGLYPIEPKQS